MTMLFPCENCDSLRSELAKALRQIAELEGRAGADPSEFGKLWDLLPIEMKSGRKDALRHFTASVKNPGDLLRCKLAVTNYVEIVTMENENNRRSGRPLRKFMNGSTFFNRWSDGAWTEEPKRVTKPAHGLHTCIHCPIAHDWECEDSETCGLSQSFGCREFHSKYNQGRKRA